MPLIIPSNSASAAGGYAVDNSCRFNGSSDYLRKTFSGTSTDSKKCTMSFWSKRTATGENNRFLTANITGSLFRDSFYFTAANEIAFFLNNANNGNLRTNRLFRDNSAWYHIVIVIDTTQGTASNRLKMYINGIQETSFASESYPALNYNLTGFGNSVEHTIGADDSDGGSNEYYNGYMAEAVFVNGLALAPTDFGEFDEDSGIWKPIDVSGLTFGTNGFYLDFKNSGSLGADVSGNGNNFTVNNLTAIDQTTDTPTNNFATLNPLMNNVNNLPTLSEGNLEVLAVTSSDPWSITPSTIGLPKSGKWYYEVEAVSGTSGDRAAFAGWMNPSVSNPLANGSILWRNVAATNSIVSNDSPAIGSFSATTWGTNGDIIGMYIDMDNSKLYFAHNGTIQNSGTGIDFQGTFDDDTFILPVVMVINADKLSVNFGNPAANFAIASGNTDVNGYGNFEYDPSAGTFDGASKDFLAICTKNLSEVLG